MAKKNKEIAKKLKKLHKAEAQPPQYFSNKSMRRKSKVIAKQLEEMGIKDQDAMSVVGMQQQYVQTEKDKFEPKNTPKLQTRNMHKNLVRKIREMPIVTVREFLAIDGPKFREDMAKQNAEAQARAKAETEAKVAEVVGPLPSETPVTEVEVK